MYWRRKRQSISRELRHKVFERDGYMCSCCGDARAALLDVDHLWPVALGGSNRLSNLRTLCRNCNGRKGPKVTLNQLLRHHPELTSADLETEDACDRAFLADVVEAWVSDDMRIVLVPKHLRKEVIAFVIARRAPNAVKGLARAVQTGKDER